MYFVNNCNPVPGDASISLRWHSLGLFFGPIIMGHCPDRNEVEKRFLLHDATTRIINKPYQTDAYHMSIQSDLNIATWVATACTGHET